MTPISQHWRPVSIYQAIRLAEKEKREDNQKKIELYLQTHKATASLLWRRPIIFTWQQPDL